MKNRFFFLIIIINFDLRLQRIINSEKPSTSELPSVHQVEYWLLLVLKRTCWWWWFHIGHVVFFLGSFAGPKEKANYFFYLSQTGCKVWIFVLEKEMRGLITIEKTGMQRERERERHRVTILKKRPQKQTLATQRRKHETRERREPKTRVCGFT